MPTGEPKGEGPVADRLVRRRNVARKETDGEAIVGLYGPFGGYVFPVISLARRTMIADSVGRASHSDILSVGV